MNAQRLRITILGLNYAPEPTGNAPYTTSLAEGLAAAGHEVQVVTGYPHYPEWRLKDGFTGWRMNESSGGTNITRVRHHIPKSRRTLDRLHMELSFGLRILFARWHKPDVVLLVSPALFSSGMALMRGRLSPKRPAIGIWVQDLYSRGVVETGASGGRVARVMAAVESLILRRADGVVAIHDRFQQYMVNSLHVPLHNVRVIRNWTHLPQSPSVDREEIRRSLGWSDTEIIVLHAGNMGAKQGLSNVVQAARIAQERISRVRFVLMGDGNQRGELETMARGLTHVGFLKPLPGEEFMQALAAADILLVNELPEVKDMAVPSKLTSYFNSGVAVIAATDRNSVTAMEIAQSGGGIRVDAADPRALLDAAENLGNDKQAAQILGARGLKYRRDTLSQEAAIRHYDDFLSDLASTHGR